jgi:hypothetical protein
MDPSCIKFESFFSYRRDRGDRRDEEDLKLWVLGGLCGEKQFSGK